MVSGLSDDAPALRLRGVRVRYRGRAALAGIDLTVAQGETFALVGPNGAGKTTAIKVACGLLRPTTGIVEVHGVRQPSREPAPIGYCPQNDVFYGDLSIIENMEFVAALFPAPPRGRTAHIHSLIAAVGLADKADVRARHLSGGMQRRLSLAMACVHDPRLLIVEEPEAGLDPHSRVAIRRFLTRFGRRRTIVFTSHHLDEVASFADRVALLDQGRLIACGTPQEVARYARPGGLLDEGRDAPRLEDAFFALTGART